MSENSLANDANSLCNQIDRACIAARKASNPCHHQANIAIGKLSTAFELISGTRILLREAEEVLALYSPEDNQPTRGQ